MKKIINIFFVVLGIVNFNVVLAQEEAPPLKPKFFTLRDARLALGLGFEGSTTFSTLSMGKPKGLKAIYKNPRMPGETGIVHVEFDSFGKEGKDSRTINVFLNDPVMAEVKLEVSGVVMK